MRLVVILCGPPGAGKTTAARANTLGLQVFDQDDPRWRTPGAFLRAVAAVGQDPRARAVIIRSGATSSARIKARALAQATHCYLIDPGPEVALQRARSRARAGRVANEAQAVRQWYAAHDTRDGVRPFPGWANLGPATTPPPRHDPKRKYPSQSRGYGSAHRRVRAGYAQRMAAGETFTCARVRLGECAHPRDLIDASTPPDAWDLGHNEGKQGWSGPEHRDCNRRAGQKDATKARTERERAWLDAQMRRRDEPQTRRW